ncbi:MAG: alanine:cation symporter family protein, partial [Gammaproteobacteria bacterium]|nr:alanine:cation symporter family protein [Gammaproteobacteria bacterium]
AAAIRFGVARGVFSNESGLGSAAIAHAAAQTDSPVRQGIIAMLGTFIDTLIVCTLTALVILTSGAWTMTGADGGGLTGAVLTSTGFQESIVGGQYIVTIALAVFAFTTILGWSYYGERCWQYLFSERSLMVYRGLWVLAALSFANMKVDFVWNLSDTLNGLMAVPNLIGLLLLAPMVFRVTRKYFEERGEPLGRTGSPG